MDRQHLLGQIRSSASLPELLAHEENCRSRLTVQVESMYKMQKTFHRDQQSHVSHLRKQRESPHYQHVRRRPLSRHFGGLGGSYNQHTQLGNCFQQVQQLDQALAIIQTKKDQLQDQHKKAMLVKPIQASGCARSQSVCDMQKWFKSYGEPSGLTRWKDWRSSSPFVQKVKCKFKVSY